MNIVDPDTNTCQTRWTWKFFFSYLLSEITSFEPSLHSLHGIDTSGHQEETME